MELDGNSDVNSGDKGGKGVLSFIGNIYDKHYKKLMIFSMLLLVLAVLQVAIQTITTGDFMHKDVSLKGGLTLNVEKIADIKEVEDLLNSKFPGEDISVRELSSLGKQIGLIVEASLTEEKANELISAIEEKTGKLSKDDYSIEVMGSSLGASFFKATFTAVIIAFVLMAIVVFAYFRVPVPSLAVILCAFSDIITTLAVVNIMGMKIGTAGIAAFLMLIGYSVDTDILLNTKILKRTEGTILDASYRAMKTGMLMTATTMTALIVALIFTQFDVLKEIMIIMLIGLLADLIYTWIQNAGLLRWYLERKQKHEN